MIKPTIRPTGERVLIEPVADTNQELEKAVADRQPQNIQEAIDMCSAPLPTPKGAGDDIGKMLWTLRCLIANVLRHVDAIRQQRYQQAREAEKMLSDATPKKD